MFSALLLTVAKAKPKKSDVAYQGKHIVAGNRAGAKRGKTCNQCQARKNLCVSPYWFKNGTFAVIG